MSDESRVRGHHTTGTVFDEFGEELGKVTDLRYSIELPPVEYAMPVEWGRKRTMPIEFTTTIEIPKVRWWTKVWCSLWRGHWPDGRDGLWDFAMDYYSCRCGAVHMPAEELIELSERYGRRLPRGC